MAKATSETTSAADFLPARLSYASLVKAAGHCEGCPLYRRATQTVFGEGPKSARAILIGEQPGDEEDLAGHPFVGPAGRYLDKCLIEAGIDRSEVYVTNAVKHFKWTPRGKRRLHGKPNSRELAACRPWLLAEIEWIEPELLVLLGASAAQSLLGSSFRVTRQRGQLLKVDYAPWALATYHPSAILRAPDEANRARMKAEFIADLKLVAKQLKRAS
ncbi:MAG TPA: UdgX family uracil-DNA binding protein [Pirellulales bacterium]|jgi:DNA polymerase|nr:UdgX family uracil-DNA binding protein [Pirellulales bacterium]